MFDQIKTWLAAAVFAVIAAMGIFIRVLLSDKKALKREVEKTETERDHVIQINESNQKVQEVEQKIDKAVESVRDTPIDDRRARMLKRAKDYHGNKD